MDEIARVSDQIDQWNYEMVYPEEETNRYPYNQTQEKNFVQYDGKPFASFKDPSECESDPDEVIFSQFKDWLLTCQSEGFLYTFEPKPTLMYLNIGKCPYMHTGLTCEEKLALLKKAEEDERMKKELEEFVRKRLRLIQKLLLVYKKAKRGIEDEYLKNLSKKDPYCNYKRRAASKRIVDMMIKQFALEYLYLKSLKVKKEIETIHCYLIDTERMRHLRNIHKYTLRTAEKLRLLLEKECNEDNEEPETYFEESTLKDMARMYLNEIENMVASAQHFPTEDWSSEQFWEGSSSSECIPPDYEALSDIIENRFLHGDFPKGSEGTSDISMTIENTVVSSDKEETVEAESRFHYEDDEQTSSKKFETLSEIEEVTFKTDLEPEGSLGVMEEIKREILKPFYSLQDEDVETLVSEAEEEKSDEEFKRLAELDLNRAEIELLEEFKKELWLMDCFNFYTTRIRPDLHGKMKLVHERSIYDKFLEQIVDSADTSTIETESTVDSVLNNCLTYLGNYSHKKDSHPTKTTTQHKSEISIPGVQYDADSLDLQSDDNNLIIKLDAQSEMQDQLQFQPSFLSKHDSSSGSFQNEPLRTIRLMGHHPPGETMDAPLRNVPSQTSADLMYSLSAMEGISRGDEMIRESEVSISVDLNFRSVPASLSNSENYENELTAKISSVTYYSDKSKAVRPSTFMLPSRDSSIPSFSGDLPDPLKTYEKCLREREEEAGEMYDPRFERLHSDQITMPVFMQEDRINESGSIVSETQSPRGSKQSNASRATDKLNQQKSDSNQSEKKNSLDASETSPNKTIKKCLPTLIEVMDHFTKSLKGETISSSETANEPSVVEEEEPLPDWNELMALKWNCPFQKRAESKIAECDFDTSPYINKLRKSNKQYMNNHPEMSAIISLILREFSMKRPQKDFVTFIRNTVFDKNFAKKLSSYLTVNNKAYRRRNGIDLDDCGKGLQTKSHNMFSFDLPSAQYWQEWGVDFKKISEKFGPQGDRYICKEKESVVEQDEYKDPWDLDRILRECVTDSKKTGKEKRVCGEWSKLTRTLARRELRDQKKEATCITALAQELDWGEPPDLRSSCQKLFTKRILLHRQDKQPEHKHKK